jgi:hypothetical protein
MSQQPVDPFRAGDLYYCLPIYETPKRLDVIRSEKTEAFGRRVLHDR